MTMNAATNKVEQQLTVLLRRGNRVHLATQNGDVALERSAYGIMCQLADEGPQRLGVLAASFGLDPSTITRQVQDLERLRLAGKEKDPTDGRAFILALTPHGRDVLDQTRNYRQERLSKALAGWPEEDVTSMARLLRHFNAALNRLDGHLLMALGGLLEFV